MNIKILASSSKGNAYIVSNKKTTLLLDAGITAKEIRQKSGFAKIDGALITHAHLDHSRAATSLMKTGVDIYTGADTATACKLAGHRLHIIEPFKNTRIGVFDILPFDVQHDITNYGYLITSDNGERLIYATDTYYIKYVFPDITHILLECNFDGETLKQNISNGYLSPIVAKRLYKSHMSLETVVMTLKAWDLSKLRQIFLIHLSDGNSNIERIKNTIQALIGAERSPVKPVLRVAEEVYI